MNSTGIATKLSYFQDRTVIHDTSRRINFTVYVIQNDEPSTSSIMSDVYLTSRIVRETVFQGDVALSQEDIFNGSILMLWIYMNKRFKKINTLISFVNIFLKYIFPAFFVK